MTLIQPKPVFPVLRQPETSEPSLPTVSFTATKDGTGAIVVTAGTASLTIPVTVQSMPFTDVALSSWYYGAVEHVTKTD